MPCLSCSVKGLCHWTRIHPPPGVGCGGRSTSFCAPCQSSLPLLPAGEHEDAPAPFLNPPDAPLPLIGGAGTLVIGGGGMPNAAAIRSYSSTHAALGQWRVCVEWHGMCMQDQCPPHAEPGPDPTLSSGDPCSCPQASAPPQAHPCPSGVHCPRGPKAQGPLEQGAWAPARALSSWPPHSQPPPPKTGATTGASSRTRLPTRPRPLWQMPAPLLKD